VRTFGKEKRGEKRKKERKKKKGCGKPHNEEITNMYSSPKNARIINVKKGEHQNRH
jgi:hypothetical protein